MTEGQKLDLKKLRSIIASILFKDNKWGDAVFRAVCALLLIIILGILSLLILG